MNIKSSWKALIPFCLLMTGLFTSSYGQFAQGTKAAGGGMSFVSDKISHPSAEDLRQNSFQLHLNGGYMFQENLEAGLNVGYSSRSFIVRMPVGHRLESTSLFLFGPYARAYYTVTDVVGLFGEGNLNFGFGGGSNDIRTLSFELGIRPGVILMVNENLGLETKIGFFGYQRSARGDKEDFADTKVVSNRLQASVDMSNISFGFRLYLHE